MQLSDRGLAFVIANEGLRLKAYRDQAGIWTIGYGSIIMFGEPVHEGMIITQPQAANQLALDCQKFTAALRRYTPATINLTQNQIDSLIDFMYNCGAAAYSRSSLRRTILAGQPVVEDLFTRWNKVRDPATGKLVAVAGLTRRRKREFAMYIE